jgi:hypothetical protein
MSPRNPELGTFESGGERKTDLPDGADYETFESFGVRDTDAKENPNLN